MGVSSPVIVKSCHVCGQVCHKRVNFLTLAHVSNLRKIKKKVCTCTFVGYCEIFGQF